MSRLPYYHENPTPCPWCRKEVTRSDQKFCSKSCLASSSNLNGIKREKISKNCLTCSKLFTPKDQRPNFLNKKKYCSLQCGYLNKQGKKFSQEHCKNISLAASRRVAHSVFTKGVGGKRNDIGHYARSSWEANIARLLNYLNIQYEFEKHQFTLIDSDGSNIIYTPDFKIYNRFIEVKGWWNEKSIKLKQLMGKQYPNIKITYIDEKLYKKLTIKFAKKINNWEFKTRNQRKKIITHV